MIRREEKRGAPPPAIVHPPKGEKTLVRHKWSVGPWRCFITEKRVGMHLLRVEEREKDG